MTQTQRISALATAIGVDIKDLRTTIGVMSSLSTTNKGNIVAAINEVFALANSGGASAVIDDVATSGTAKTYSIDKIKSQIEELKQALLGGVPAAAYDTLKEIADYIATDVTGAASMTTALGLRVRVDAAQSFNSTQQLQARNNIDAFGTPEIGNPDTDLVAAYTTAKA
ncbi:MAG: hypothetical protein EOO42_01210 [Flavobacteriales bacterium]|nr:MAG: hypothetical protein EOO42_01210 [Flavobacteriales bacterium]